MSRRVVIVSMLVVPMLSCASGLPFITSGVLPVETEFFLLNLTRDRFLTVALRDNDASGSGDARAFVQSPLIPPGAVLRQRFLDLFPETGGCPDRLDVRAHVYELNAPDAQPGSIPIGGDPCVDNPPDVSDVDPVAVASAEFLGVPACELIVLSTYTIVLRETEDVSGELVFAQGVPGLPGPVRRLTQPELADLTALPPMLPAEPLTGRVLTQDGQPVGGIGVLLRTRFRITGNDEGKCPDADVCLGDEPVGLCYSGPVALCRTANDGRFEFIRPPGAYRVEVFQDGFQFRPCSVIVESPLDNITIIAEPDP